jgi:hypothetical protein
MKRRTRPPARGERPATATHEVENPQLEVMSIRVEKALRQELEAYAKREGISRSLAASEYLSIARETLRERDGIPVGRADDLLEAFDSLRALLELLGPPTLGIVRLLAHWATRVGGLKVSEDELLAEIRTVAADEWEQAVAEAEREVHEARRELSNKETS